MAARFPTLGRMLRVVVFGVLAIVLPAALVGSQPIDIGSGAPSIDVKWIVTQGGLVIVVMVLLWERRQVARNTLSDERDAHAQTREALAIVAKLATDYGNHISANTELIRGMKNTIDLYMVRQASWRADDAP